MFALIVKLPLEPCTITIPVVAVPVVIVITFNEALLTSSRSRDNLPAAPGEDRLFSDPDAGIRDPAAAFQVIM